MANARVARWGNSLAIRLPATLVRELDLKEGDHIDIDIDMARRMELARQERRKEALEGLRAYRGLLPADFKFDRDEANAR